MQDLLPGKIYVEKKVIYFSLHCNTHLHFKILVNIQNALKIFK